MVHGGKHFNGAEDVVKHKNSNSCFSLPKATSYKSVKEGRDLNEKLHLFLSPSEVEKVPK